MLNHDRGDVTFYPAYCFHLSPTYNTWARLSVTDVHALKERSGFEGQDLYFYLNHPIRWIRLVGIVVALDVFPTRYVFTLDDSSGATIDITCQKRTSQGVQDVTAPQHDVSKMQEIESKGVGASGGELDLAGVDVGTVVKLKGSIGTWWGNRQIKLERIWILHTTSQEVSAWSETVAFHTDILRKPWMISEEEQIRARGGSDGAQRRRKARTSRKSQSNARPQLRTSTKNEGIRFRSEKQWEHEKDVCSGPKVVISEKTGLREAQKRAREEELEKRRLESRQGENPQPQVIMNKVVSKPVLRKSSNQVKAKNEKDLGPELQRFYQDEATFKKEQLRQQRDEDRAERQRLFSKRLRTANGSC